MGDDSVTPGTQHPAPSTRTSAPSTHYPMLISYLPTPQVLIDRRRLLANIERVQQLCNAAGLRLRPHAKTHKSPVIARWQIDQGAVGVCCAKLGEAETFVDAGIDAIRLPYPVQPVNAPRVLALM